MKKSLPNSSLLKVNQINLFDKFYLILNPNFTVYEICDELLSEFGENKVNVLEKNISNFINDEKNLKLKEENLINLINKESEQIFRIKNNHSFWLIKQVKFNHYFTKYIYLKFEDITLLYNLKNEIKDKEKIISNIEKTNQTNRVKLNEISKLLIKNKMEAISIDIEKTKQIEISLKSKADIYFALNSSCIIAKTDLKGKILEVNHQFCAISKYSREELIGRDHRILNSNYHQKEFIKNLWQTIKQGKIWKGEIKNIAKDGSYYWVDTTIIPFLNEFSEPYEFLAIRHDISQIKEQQIKLEINELKYRELFENNLVAIYCINLENLKIIEINNLAYQLFGYESKEQFDTFFSAKKHFINFFEIKKNIQQLKEIGEIKNNILKMKKNDGSYFWVEVFCNKNKDSNFAQLVLIDITEHQLCEENLEKKIIQRTLELTKALEREVNSSITKSRFISVASHEFRTPLSTINSSANLIAKYVDNQKFEKVSKHISKITSNIKHLTEILEDFLSIEQLEKGEFDIKYTFFNVNDFCLQLITDLEGMLLSRSQNITFSHSGEEWIYQSNKIIKNILINLLSNASKYSEKNKTIEITSFASSTSVLFEIKDYGIGIPLKDQQYLFKDFYRSENVENIQGTGLGLSIVKKYVQLLKGTIKFESEINVGTIFTIEIPIKTE